MEDVRRDDLEMLVSELSWLKRLAVALVRDEDDANDIVQETWLVAAERAPTDGRPLKPWLSRVALNLVRMRSRSSKRRSAREAAVPVPAESEASPDELLGRLRAQRMVADEVLRLAEPYRNIVLLRYFEDLDSTQIARRLGIPEGTVRRRLKTALDELRGRLAAEQRKTGHAVFAALVPLAAKQGAAGSAALGAIFVKKAIAVVAVVIGLLVLGVSLYEREDASKPVVAAEHKPSGAPRAVVAANEARARIVVDVSDGAAPIGDAWVRAEADGDVVTVKTARDGSASLDLAPGPWSIAASAVGHEPAATNVTVAAAHDDRVRLVLAPGGQALTGTVTDATGGAIAGARIDAARLQLNARAGGAVAVAFSDRDGRYKLSLGAGQIFVAASHPEYAAQTRYVDLGSGGATADFALVPGGVIEGVVRDMRTDQPVAGAAVRASLDVSDRVVKADAAGKFRFAGLRPGAYELSARDGARSSHVPVGVEVGVAEQHADVVVLVGGTATIRGKVVDDTGAPATDVTVTALGNGANGKATSDGTGAFVLEGLAPGRWALRGASDRYISDGNAIVQLVKSDVAGVVVRVQRGLEVRGHVEPRKLCDVAISKVERRDAIPHGETITTGADGVFRFAPLGAGSATLVARCPGGEHGSVAITVAPGGGESILPIKAGGSIEGRVVDESGKPLAGVMVNAESSDDVTRIENGAVVTGFKALTQTGGTFAIDGLGAATYRLSVLDSGRPMKPKKSVKVALAAGQRATGIEVVVERPTGTIRGTVTGPDGAPIAEAWVTLYQTGVDQADAMRSSEDTEPQRLWITAGDTEGRDPPPALTDARGQFVITNLLRGRYQVAAEAQAGKLRGTVADVTTDAEITIPLAGVSSLRGTVRGPRGPTEMFSVVLKGPIGAAPTGGARAFPPPTEPKVQSRSFVDGAFEFARLEPGDYSIEVESTDGTGDAKAHVASDRPGSVAIILVPNGTVSGRLVDKAGNPLSGMRVALIPDQPSGGLRIELHAPPLTSGPDGRFQIDGPPGLRALVVLTSKPNAKRGLSVAPGKTIDVGDVIVDDVSAAPR